MGLTHTLILCPAALVFGVSIKLCYNMHTPRSHREHGKERKGGRKKQHKT